MHCQLDLPELQSLDPEEIVTHKAREAYKVINRPVLVEDSSLTFNALGRLPGPLIKWFLTELKREGLCQLLNSYSDRSARAEARFALYDGQTIHIFEGKVDGLIADAPRGQVGMGWDSIFIPEGCHESWGEMSEERLLATSMRQIALRKLKAFLEDPTSHLVH